jgi:hypothetical protein
MHARGPGGKMCERGSVDGTVIECPLHGPCGSRLPPAQLSRGPRDCRWRPTKPGSPTYRIIRI